MLEEADMAADKNNIPSKQDMLDALEARIGKYNQQRLTDAVVAVCGLGGLGSNIAIALARAGVGKLILIDFDRVDVTNLHRQQYKACQVGMPKTQALYENLKEIAPYIELATHDVRLDEDNTYELIKSADVICEAFDNAECKAMLVNLVLEKFPDKYIVGGSGMAGFDSANSIKTKKVMGKFYLAGDQVSDVNDGIGLVASRVMVCAAHQAHMIIRLLLGEKDV